MATILYAPIRKKIELVKDNFKILNNLNNFNFKKMNSDIQILENEIKSIKEKHKNLINILDEEPNDYIICSVANFLKETGNKQHAYHLSQCKIDNFSVKVNKFELFSDTYTNIINLSVTGGAYAFFRENIKKSFPNTNIIENAFNLIFTKNHFDKNFDKLKKSKKIIGNNESFHKFLNSNRKIKNKIQFEIRHINPKELSIDKCMGKLNQLKKIKKEKNV